MGLFEMLIIAVVALLVVGPERMPEAVRGVAMTIGRLKRMFNNTREEFEKHIGADDIRLQLHNEQIMENLKKIEQDTANIDSEIERRFMAQDDYQDPLEFREDDTQQPEAKADEPLMKTPSDESTSPLKEAFTEKNANPEKLSPSKQKDTKKTPFSITTNHLHNDPQ